MKWLVDTNVVSELIRKTPDEKTVAWLGSVPLSDLYISDVSLAEIRFGIETSSNPVRRAQIRQWLEDVVRPMFDSRTLPVTEQVLFVWRGLASTAQSKGKTIAQADSLIAATAAAASFRICTRDVAPFLICGLPVFNPFTGERFNGA